VNRLLKAIPSTRALLLGTVVLAAILRVLQLDFQPLWWDEGYSVFFATRAFGDMIARTAIDIHPPLYYALLQLWIAALGKDVAVLRLLSGVIGVASIPLLYLVAKKLYNARVGVVAAFLLAIAPLSIFYSQEVRMYGMVMFLALASVAAQLKIFEPEIGNRTSNIEIADLLYVVLTAALLYLQYFAAFLIAAQIAVVLYLKFRARQEINLRAWVVRWLVIGALYLPWVLYAGPKLYAYVTAKVGIEQYTRLDPFTYFAQHLVAFSVGHVSAWTWLAWGAILFALVVVLGIILSATSQTTANKSHPLEHSTLSASALPLTAIYLVIPLTLGFLVNLLYPFHPLRYERLLLFVAPFFWVLVANGIVALFERQRVLGYAATALIALACAFALFDFYTVERYADEDYRPLIAEMEKYAAENDLVYAVYPWQIGYLETYYRGAPLNVYEVPAETWLKHKDVMSQDLARLRHENARAWLLAYQKQGRLIEDRIANEYGNDYVVTDQNFGNTRLEYFARGNETDFELAPQVYSQELLLRLNYAAFDSDTRPTLAFARFGWNAGNDAYSYSLRVADAAGNKIAQQDASIPRGATTMRRALALPKPLAPGEYALQIVAYRRADGAPLSAPNGETALTLARITVAP
jgi:4-amino-4-deoxy-L-arabinose transferase-like glycosyltransferase